MALHHVIVVLGLVFCLTSTSAQNLDQVCMLVPQSTEECFKSFEGKQINNIASKIYCLQNTLWNFAPDNRLTEEDRAYLRNLTLDISNDVDSGWSSPPKFLYPRRGHRVRKEYRLLTPEERQRFHNALTLMYNDGRIGTFARLHAEGAVHHGGPSFLPWHRMYLILFEEALRTYDPKVFIPYWASPIDFEMDNPVNSVLWTPEYLGNGEGPVTSGPSAYWVTSLGNLERNFGKESRLFSTRDINLILSQCTLANISRPTAARRHDLEYYHGGAHRWVGGDMSALATTGFDPIFLLHHAYIDYIWDRFRKRQRINCRMEPSTDYPEVRAGTVHHPDEAMTGMLYFKNRDGIKPHWTDNWYAYDQEPSCPNCCPGCTEPAPIYCDIDRNLCVARSKLIDEFGQLIPVIQDSIRAAPLPETRLIPPIMTVVPRNRGELFEGPPNDGRTYFTAIQDAVDNYVPTQFLNATVSLTTVTPAA